MQRSEECLITLRSYFTYMNWISIRKLLFMFLLGITRPRVEPRSDLAYFAFTKPKLNVLSYVNQVKIFWLIHRHVSALGGAVFKCFFKTSADFQNLSATLCCRNASVTDGTRFLNPHGGRLDDWSLKLC